MFLYFLVFADFLSILQVVGLFKTHGMFAYLQGVERPKERGLKSLRTARELQQGMVSLCFCLSYAMLCQNPMNDSELVSTSCR